MNHKHSLKRPAYLPHFVVNPNLLEGAHQNNPSALFHIGVQALMEERYGYATTFLRLAKQQGHTEAAIMLIEAEKQLSAQANEQTNLSMLCG